MLVLFHGLCNYDSHFILHKLTFQPLHQNINIILRNSEKYLTFNCGCLHFKDLYQFLAEPLATLVENLKTKGVHRFRNLNRFVMRENKRELMTSKGIFPFSYVTHLHILLEESLPAKKKFYNDLSCSHITDEQYSFAQKVWSVFHCVNLKCCLHAYLLADCLLLADVYKNYRDCCLTDHCLDPVHYYSSPHFTFDAFLLFSNEKLEFLTEVDQFLFFESGYVWWLVNDSKAS